MHRTSPTCIGLIVFDGSVLGNAKRYGCKHERMRMRLIGNITQSVEKQSSLIELSTSNAPFYLSEPKLEDAQTL